MAIASIIIQRTIDLDVIIVTPAVNPLAFICYVKFRLSKGGYLLASVKIALIEGIAGTLKEENLGFIGKGYLIEQVTDDTIVFKKPKKGRLLYAEFNRNNIGKWEKSEKKKSLLKRLKPLK
jgi:hypothetical protein